MANQDNIEQANEKKSKAVKRLKRFEQRLVEVRKVREELNEAWSLKNKLKEESFKKGREVVEMEWKQGVEAQNRKFSNLIMKAKMHTLSVEKSRTSAMF